MFSTELSTNQAVQKFTEAASGEVIMLFAKTIDCRLDKNTGELIMGTEGHSGM